MSSARLPIMNDDSITDNTHGNWIIESKFELHRPNIELVTRKRLLSLLDDVIVRRVILISAPAGFGKSSLLGQWSGYRIAQGIPVAWLTLDENDADARQFLSYLALSLSHAKISIGDLEVAARNGFSESPAFSVLSRLMAQIRAFESPCILVLDDYHRTGSGEVDEVVAQLIQKMPDNFTLVINSRWAPDLNIPMLVASGDAVEIGPNELRLTRSETISVLGDQIELGEAEEIFGQTEGWPVAVQLARVQKQARPRVRLKSAGSSRLVALYLTDQVLSTLDTDVRDFLLTVSVLERFSPQLVNAVRETQDSWEIIDKLQPLTALIIPLDLDGDWFRLHHLFAEYLREGLRKEDPARANQVLLLASCWHASHGYLIESVSYAAQAADYKECERLVLDVGGWKIILTEGIGVLRSLFRIIPAKVVSSSPRLLVARAYLHCKDGEYRRARGILDASQALRQVRDSEQYDRDHEIIDSLVNTYENRKSWSIAKLNKPYDLTTDGTYDPLEAGTLACTQAITYLSFVQLSEAEAMLKKAFTFMRRSGSVLGLNYSYLHAGVAAMYRADMDMAQANITQALDLSVSNFGSDSGLKHMALVLDYALKVWGGLASEKDIQDFSGSLEHIAAYDGWAEVYIIGLDAAFSLAEQCGNMGFAESVTDLMLSVADKRQLERLDVFAELQNIRANIRQGRLVQAEEASINFQEWLGGISPDEVFYAWHWHAYFLGAGLHTQFSKAPSTDSLKALSRAMSFAEQARARFHQIRLHVSLALAMKQLHKPDDAVSELVVAIKQASRQKLMGPFLNDDRLIKMLKEVKAYMQANDEDLIAINFVSAVLARKNELRPYVPNQLLSGREQEILEQLALGKSNKQMARQFELTDNTVKYHLKNIYAKLKVKSRTQAIAAAHNLKLFD